MRELLQALAFVALPVLTWWMIRVVIPELEERMRGRQPIESKEEVKMRLIQLYFHCEDTKRWCLKMIEALDNGAKMDLEEEMTSEAVSEMTFEEEVVLYRKEAEAEFTKEKGDCDSNGVNNILRRGMRIIRKAEERLAATQHQKEYRPHGRWVPVDCKQPCDEWDCTACGQRRTFLIEMDADDMEECYPYCSNCGAKMDEEEEK